MGRIVLIEPDVVLAQQYQKAITDDANEVVVTHSAATALSALDEPADMIILELQLGSHNGIEFLYEIRSYQDLATIPVVVLSNVNPSYVTTAQGYELLGISEYLYKPQTSLQQLKRTITDLLGDG